MNVTAPTVIQGRPLGEATVDILDTLISRGALHLRDIQADTGRDQVQLVKALWNLRRCGKVTRIGGRGGRWTATPEGRKAMERVMGEPDLRFVVTGSPRGSERAQTHGRMRYHSAAHVVAMDTFVIAARGAAAAARWARTAEPVRVLIETFHRRPLTMSKARKWWGDNVRHYRGKPDADNIAKLALDACTAAGLWTDDTVVAQLEVRRWWVAVDAQGVQDAERTVVQVEAL